MSPTRTTGSKSRFDAIGSRAAPEEGPALPAILQLEQSGLRRHRKKDGTVIEVQISTQDVYFGQRSRYVMAQTVNERPKMEPAASQIEPVET
jgi:hypothetical protein